uniref:Uncharacterized protein n=1 Tax=Eutreptiella gymnastica TaxID=73025 RepID=A0A7S1J748_9EUGL|mmetsp:Transcript_73137/g.128860  ORF Transcript_73137/g.128860 Transcript_73137/m.128860 type:complete len:102 (+) Transcript_73137:333-638(+)
MIFCNQFAFAQHPHTYLDENHSKDTNTNQNHTTPNLKCDRAKRMHEHFWRHGGLDDKCMTVWQMYVGFPVLRKHASTNWCQAERGAAGSVRSHKHSLSPTV